MRGSASYARCSSSRNAGATEPIRGTSTPGVHEFGTTPPARSAGGTGVSPRLLRCYEEQGLQDARTALAELLAATER